METQQSRCVAWYAVVRPGRVVELAYSVGTTSLGRGYQITYGSYITLLVTCMLDTCRLMLCI